MLVAPAHGRFHRHEAQAREALRAESLIPLFEESDTNVCCRSQLWCSRSLLTTSAIAWLGSRDANVINSLSSTISRVER